MKSHSTLCPDLGEIKLRKRLDAASRMNVVKINEVEYNVLDGDLNGLVHLQNRSCTCRKFDLEQLPCKHAIAFLPLFWSTAKFMNSFGDAAGMEVGPLNGHVKHMEQ
ncbi:unnamed protein product, partial [Prunus brigantina]